MADYEVYFHGDSAYFNLRGITHKIYRSRTKEEVLSDAKDRAEMMEANAFTLYSLGNGKCLGTWRYKGSRWFVEKTSRLDKIKSKFKVR